MKEYKDVWSYMNKCSGYFELHGLELTEVVTGAI